MSPVSCWVRRLLDTWWEGRGGGGGGGGDESQIAGRLVGRGGGG